LDKIVGLAKMAEPIEIPFGRGQTHIGPETIIRMRSWSMVGGDVDCYHRHFSNL